MQSIIHKYNSLGQFSTTFTLDHIHLRYIQEMSFPAAKLPRKNQQATQGECAGSPLPIPKATAQDFTDRYWLTKVSHDLLWFTLAD